MSVSILIKVFCIWYIISFKMATYEIKHQHNNPLHYFVSWYISNARLWVSHLQRFHVLRSSDMQRCLLKVFLNDYTVSFHINHSFLVEPYFLDKVVCFIPRHWCQSSFHWIPRHKPVYRNNLVAMPDVQVVISLMRLLSCHVYVKWMAFLTVVSLFLQHATETNMVICNTYRIAETLRSR